MGKSTEAPTCRFCGKQHRGTCMDHEAKGAISSQIGTEQSKPKRVAVFTGVSLTAALTRAIAANPSIMSGGSSAVERRPSKPTVEGSTPSPRSKKPRAGSRAKAPTDHRKAGSSPAEVNAGSTPAPALPSTKGRGRPKLHPDRKAYLAEKARERRAKLRADRPEQTNRGK